MGIEDSKECQRSLILIGGNPGSGKTTIAQKLARMLRSSWVEGDHLRPLLNAALTMRGEEPENFDSDLYKRALRPGLYAALKNLIVAQLQNGVPVIFSSPMQLEFTSSNDFLPDMRRLAYEANAVFMPVWVWAPESVLRDRLHERGEVKDKGKLHDWNAYRQTVHFGPICESRMLDLAARSIHPVNIENSGPQSIPAIENEILRRLSDLSR